MQGTKDSLEVQKKLGLYMFLDADGHFMVKFL